MGNALKKEVIFPSVELRCLFLRFTTWGVKLRAKSNSQYNFPRKSKLRALRA